MKISAFSVVLLISGILYAQSDFITHVTNYDYDSRNPSVMFLTYLDGGSGRFVFEIHQGNQVNIGLINYIVAEDSFSSPVFITNNSYKNIKPSITDYFTSGQVILFQTDQHGTEDIAISLGENGSWSSPVFLTNSAADETNPSFPVMSIYGGTDTLWVIYEKEGSIHLLSFRDTVTADIKIFESNDTLYYSNAAADGSGTFNFAAVEHSPSKQNLVYRSYNNVTGYLSPVLTLVDSGNSDAPGIFYGTTFLERNMMTFEYLPAEGYQNIYYMDYWPDFGDWSPWVDSPEGDISSFRIALVDLMVDRMTEKSGSWEPYTYRLTRNDSTFIRLGLDDNYPYKDTLLYTRVNNVKEDVGLMGMTGPYLFYFTFFEDSLNGHINLFAHKQIIVVGNVTQENPSADEFILMQNYPNPFNPSTKLSYIIGTPSFVTLKIYDVLGNEVAVLVNEAKLAGTYHVNFNAEHLSSGIYFYRLKASPDGGQAGVFSQTKKMILMK